jgi:hypothetical protein
MDWYKHSVTPPWQFVDENISVAEAQLWLLQGTTWAVDERDGSYTVRGIYTHKPTSSKSCTLINLHPAPNPKPQFLTS